MERITNSIGNWPPAGRGSGVFTITFKPATLAASGCSELPISTEVRFRSDHGLRIMPENPNDAAVSWKDVSYSGVAAYICCTWRA